MAAAVLRPVVVRAHACASPSTISDGIQRSREEEEEGAVGLLGGMWHSCHATTHAVCACGARRSDAGTAGRIRASRGGGGGGGGCRAAGGEALVAAGFCGGAWAAEAAATASSSSFTTPMGRREEEDEAAGDAAEAFLGFFGLGGRGDFGPPGEWGAASAVASGLLAESEAAAEAKACFAFIAAIASSSRLRFRSALGRRLRRLRLRLRLGFGFAPLPPPAGWPQLPCRGDSAVAGGATISTIGLGAFRSVAFGRCSSSSGS